MLAYWAAGATIILSTLTIIAQLAVLPLILKRTESVRTIVGARVAAFQVTERQTAVNLNLAQWHHNIETRTIHHILGHCKRGRPGVAGPDGKDGPSGKDGETGKRGEDARDMLSKEEHKCIICPQGAMGPVGAPGPQGPSGNKGEKGPPGIPSDDGIDGEIGDEGELGPVGFPGHTGRPGTPGKSAAGGSGLPGPKGAQGPLGRAGAQGSRGKRNYIYGSPGPVGQNGPRGLDGIPGSLGERGKKGEAGEKGSDARFCPCPLEISLLHQYSEPQKPGASSQKSISALDKQAFPPAAPPSHSAERKEMMNNEKYTKIGSSLPLMKNKDELKSASMKAQKEESGQPSEYIRRAPVTTPALDDVADMSTGTLRFGQQDELDPQETSEPFVPAMDSIDSLGQTENKDVAVSEIVDVPDLPREHSEWKKQLARERIDVLEESHEAVSDANEVAISSEEEVVSPGESYDDEQQDYVEATTVERRRFKYVTKRPRRQH